MSEEEICCPKFDPALWDGKVLDWTDKKFVRDYCNLLDFGSAMKRVSEKMKRSGALMQDGMRLSDRISAWQMILYIATDREVEGADNVALSGKFLCKSYEGNFMNADTWDREIFRCEVDFERYAREKGFSTYWQYMWYTACPECAKKHGKEYVIVVGRIRE